jgi:predicted O-methyltransferase YrrM
VKAGTSFGVSTLYLAAAVRDNQVENGVVISTEYGPQKAAIARANFQVAGSGSAPRTTSPSRARRRR